jgi:hypothetical protein
MAEPNPTTPHSNVSTVKAYSVVGKNYSSAKFSTVGMQQQWRNIYIYICIYTLVQYVWQSDSSLGG